MSQEEQSNNINQEKDMEFSIMTIIELEENSNDFNELNEVTGLNYISENEIETETISSLIDISFLNQLKKDIEQNNIKEQNEKYEKNSFKEKIKEESKPKREKIDTEDKIRSVTIKELSNFIHNGIINPISENQQNIESIEKKLFFSNIYINFIKLFSLSFCLM